ncbi:MULTISPECIES: hypothetical protein [Geobacter]|uniref:hypothetical protein n=1 Tax=Geobacter TaxID=28231 RepID=UPI002B29468C|nr:hypothetical protein [Geobacter sulfurreducens]BET59641.1 hypothetical protein GEO60473_26810 [Geobacter sp. 60473]HML77082.1 hypothetical protein [Geobacter sulfurreducens]
MVTILLIADQARLEGLFSFTKESSQIHFRMCRTLNQGTEEMAESSPDFLFIQNHLSGLSGEILARHLISGQTNGRPTIVLFGDAAECAPVPGIIDSCLDLTQADVILSAAIIGLIAGAMHSQDEPAVTEAGAETEEEPATGEEAATPSQATQTADHVPPAPEPAEPSPFDQKLKSVIKETPPPVPLAEIEEQVALGRQAEPAHEGVPQEKPVRSRSGAYRSTVRPVAIGTAVLIVAAAVIYLVVSLGTSSTARRTNTPVTEIKPAASGTAQQKAASPPPAPAPETLPPGTPAIAPAQTPPAGMSGLPPFIPRQNPDRTYGEKNPGWERYLGARTEFKVYREAGVVKAIQSIDRSGVGIPESFMRGALEQMTRVRQFSINEKETKGSFHVEKGTTTAGARILIYRTAPKGSIRAFVVYFP